MASLKEIKGRIASVKSTLKITSAMKLVASAKLRKAQQAITDMLPYQRQLQRILDRLISQNTAGAESVSQPSDAGAPPVTPGLTGDSINQPVILLKTSSYIRSAVRWLKR